MAQTFLFVVFYYIIFAFFLAFMGFGALGSHLSPNKHLTFLGGFRTHSSDFKWLSKHQSISAFLLFCLRKGQKMERCLFFLSVSHRNDQNQSSWGATGSWAGSGWFVLQRLEVSHASLWEEIIGQLEIYLQRKHLHLQFCVFRIM